MYEGTFVPFYLVDAETTNRSTNTVFAMGLPNHWSERRTLKYFNTMNGLFDERARTIAAVNFQYDHYASERQYQGSALILYATAGLANLACRVLNRTKPNGTREIRVDISGDPLSLKPSTRTGAYGSTRHGHKLWRCPVPLTTQGYHGPGAGTGIDDTEVDAEDL